MLRLWSGAAYWLAPDGLLRLFSFRTQDHQPGDGTMHNGLGPPQQSLIKKRPCRLPPVVTSWQHFINLGSLF